MIGAEESTVEGGVTWEPPCITDCSILNQTSCEAVTNGQPVTPADQVSPMVLGHTRQCRFLGFVKTQSFGVKSPVNQNCVTFCFAPLKMRHFLSKCLCLQ